MPRIRRGVDRNWRPRRPNDIWTWDITRLRGPGRRNFFYLYVLLDLFSRYVPGWMLAGVENAQLAGGGTVDALASGCSKGIGPTWTSSTCTVLNGGTKQRAVQWCASTGVGWQYGLWKTTPNTTSATADCYGTITGRNQQII